MPSGMVEAERSQRKCADPQRSEGSTRVDGSGSADVNCVVPAMVTMTNRTGWSLPMNDPAGILTAHYLAWLLLFSPRPERAFHEYTFLVACRRKEGHYSPRNQRGSTRLLDVATLERELLALRIEHRYGFLMILESEGYEAAVREARRVGAIIGALLVWRRLIP